MTFVSLGFLFAAIAGGIPVVLHMINRQKAKELPFSTLRFLRISVQKTRRRRRIHDVLLMLLRMAVLILIAIGLAEPTITNLSNLWGGGTSSVAIIFDNSASMGTIDQGQSRFETAMKAAMSIMEQLQDGDQVMLTLTGGPDSPELGKLHRTHEKVFQMLQQANVSYERADLGLKLQETRKLLVDGKAQNKQIYVLTDMQELCWESLKKEAESPAGGEADKAAEKQQDESQEIPVIFVDCNRAPKPNVAVSGVDLKAAVPVAGHPINATVELFNASSVAPQQRHLELYIDGTKEDSSPVLSLPPDGRLKHDFQFVFKSGGLHRGEVRLVGDDGSKLDDRRFFAMEVDQGIPVAVVKPQRHEIAYLDDSFYLEQALAPVRAGGGAIRTTVLTAGELLSEPLSNYTVIFCVNLPAPDAETARRLHNYVAGGGNLVWICGDNVEPAAYNQMNEGVQKELLPAPLHGIRTPEPGGDRDSWYISFLDGKHRALVHLVEPASLYRSVLVYKHVQLDTSAASEAWIMARLDDGEALLTQRNVEQGTVTMLGTSVHRGWTNLPVQTIFLPLVVRLTFELAGAEQARHQALAGAPLTVQLDEGVRTSAVEVFPPSGAKLHLTTEDEGGQGSPTFTYADTHDIGIYVLQPLEGGRSRRIAYSVNVDPDEADPTKIAREELEERFGDTSLVFAEDPDDLESTFKLLREGESLWEALLAGVLIVLVFETFVSNRLSPKKEEDELEHVAPGMRRLAKKGRSAA